MAAPDDPTEYLRRLGEAGDGPHDIALAALMLGALDHPAVARAPYVTHLADMAEMARHEARVAANVEEGARMLARLLAGHYGYEGDRIDYDDPKNGNLIDVISRRRGLPVALGILYIHAARAAGFAASGLNTPGHFLIGITHMGRDAFIDPFHGGAAVGREKLTAPPRMGQPALGDLSQVEPVPDIDVLIRLENNLRTRALEAGDRPRGLELIKRMALIAPRRADIWLELAHLQEHAGSLGAARRAFETCLGLSKPGLPIHNEAALGLSTLKRRLN